MTPYVSVTPPSTAYALVLAVVACAVASPVSAQLAGTRYEAARRERAAAACEEGIAAVRLLGIEAAHPDVVSSFAYATVEEAFAALSDGDLLWVCPGVHGREGTLRVEGRRGVTLGGRGAVLTASFDRAVLSIQSSHDVTLDGLGFTHDFYWEDCSANVVEVDTTSGLTVRDSRFDGSGVIGLYLDEVWDARVTGSLFTNCVTGAVVEASSNWVSFEGNRFIHNETHLDGDLDPARVALANTLGPLGRGAQEQGSMPAPGAAEWIDWPAFVAAHPTYPLRRSNAATYVVLHHTREPFDELPMPPCDVELGEVCPEIVPFDGDLSAWMPAEHRTGLRVVTPSGVCTAALGRPVLLDTSACEASLTVAMRVDGCGDEVAPLAFAGTGLPALTWHPRVEARYPFAAAAIAEPGLRDWVGQRLSECVAADWALPATTPDSAVARWQVTLPHETFTTDLAGFQITHGNCGVYSERWVRASLATSEGTTELTLPSELVGWTPWTGVLALDGRVAALVGYGATRALLVTRSADGTLSTSVDVEYWSDNEECRSPATPIDFAYPCGP